MREKIIRRQRQMIDDFIFESAEAGYTCLLIGEAHDGQNGLPALSEIADQLQRYSTSKKVQFIVFDEVEVSDQRLSLPLLSTDFKDLKKKQYAEILHQHGILTYGLENKNTSPIEGVLSGEFDAADFLKKLGLFELCIQKMYAEHFPQKELPNDLESAAKEIYGKLGDKSAYQTKLLDYYTFSDWRITLPNKEFCNYIEQIPDVIICLVVIGVKHIPRVQKENSILDRGMQGRLSEKRKTISTFIDKPTSERSAPYFPTRDSDLTFYPITHISGAMPPVKNILH